MTTFLPVKITFVDGQTAIVSSIGEASKALAGQWPNKSAINYKQAVRLLAGVKEGTCTPRAAFAAFTVAAQSQRLAQPMRRSTGLSILDALTSYLV